MNRWLSELVEASSEREPDPEFEHVSDGALVEAFSTQASVIAAQTCRWLLMLAEIVRRRLWAEDGALTPAAWLSWKVSLGSSTAREHVRVALALADWPELRERFAEGRISYSKVRAITRYGTPAMEELLLQFAEHATGAELERILRSFDRTGGAQPREGTDPYERRSFSHRVLDDGMLEIRLRLPVEDGLAAVNTVEQRAGQLAREVRRAQQAQSSCSDGSASAEAVDDGGNHRLVPLSALRADAAAEALAEMAAELPEDTSGEDRHLVVLHAPAGALGAPREGESTAVAVEDRGGTALPGMSSRVLRRLSCGGRVRTVTYDEDGEVAGVGNERRRPTTRQRMELFLRDRHCRFPGCGARRGLHAHHIIHWGDGGPTELWNLALLCAAHHRFVHDRGWTVIHDGAGAFRFRPPEREVLPPAAELPGTEPDEFRWPTGVDGTADDRYVYHRGQLQPDHDGSPIDIDACLFVLYQELDRLRAPESVAAAA